METLGTYVTPRMSPSGSTNEALTQLHFASPIPILLPTSKEYGDS